MSGRARRGPVCRRGLALVLLGVVFGRLSARGQAGPATGDSAVAQTPVPAIQTAEPKLRQLPVADVMQLPFAPEPQRPSLVVTQALGAVAPMALAGGVKTPVATREPLALSLADAVNLGLERNLQVLADAQTARQVSGLRLVALNALLPSLTPTAMTETEEINLAARGFNVSVVGGFLPPGSPPFSNIVKVDVTSAQLNVDQTLFNLPAFEIYKAAKVQTEIARLNTLSNRGEIVQQVATQYLRILADEATIRDGEAQLVTDRELERQAQARKDAGVGTNLDLLRARVNRQQREQNLVQARNAFEKDKIQLNRVMGVAADQPLTLTDPVPYHELAGLPLEVAMRVAYARRKDLLSLQAQLRSAQLQRKAVGYERLPAAKVGGYYGVLGETFGLYHGVFLAQGSIDFPIFEEARFKGDRVGADAQVQRLRGQVESLRADVGEQLRSAMLDVNTSDELVKSATSNVDLSKEALSEALLRYKAGVDDTLPVVQAQSTLSNAQSQVVNALLQFNQAKLQLARYTGVLESQYDSYLNE